MHQLRLLLPLFALFITLPAFAQDGASEGEAPPAEPPGNVEQAPVSEPPAEVAQPEPARPTTEIDCENRIDDDGDAMVDCADSDCFQHPACEFGSGTERNNETCSDWIDNDGDGAIDCEDEDCEGNAVTVCHGSVRPGHANGDTVPGLEGDAVPEDFIGTGDDASGENNDYTCSDGIDNDGDGRIDCADFGCRFDPQVTVCTVSPGFRASIVAGVGASLDLEEAINGEPAEAGDVSFTRLQLRLLGSIPFINNSFFLLSMRLERSMRLTFAHFQVPLGDRGHYFAINSGSGSLSSALIVSTAKQPLLDPPFLLTNAFEQGNGAALEFGGPIMQNHFMTYRLFLAGGSGRSNGNVGGRFFPDDNENFTYTAGAQVGFNFIGHFNRLDSPMLYTKAPLGLALVVGAKWDQRATERYPAVNALLQFRHSYFLFRFENYFKYTLDFGGSVQNAFNAQVSLLLWPRHILLAADFGMYTAGDFDELPMGSPQDQPLDEYQFRVALHWYWFRNIGLLSLLYTEAHTQGALANASDPNSERRDDTVERSIRLEAQFRF